MNPTVIVADDSPVVRSGLCSWLTEAAIEVVAEVADGAAAIESVERLRPQLLITEALLPKRNGIECLAALREADISTPVLFFSGHDNPTYAARASALGAAGYLPKSSDRNTLIEAVRQTAGGGSCWPEGISRRLTGAGAPTSAQGSALATPLTARENEVLKQLSFGLSNKEIALALGISYETVKEHVQHILRKLGVTDRTQAAVWAVRHGMA